MRRKNLTISVAFILCAFAARAANGADKTVTNKELGFEITFPEAWNVKDKPRGVGGEPNVTVAVDANSPGPADKSASVGIQIEKIANGATAKSEAERWVADAKNYKKYKDVQIAKTELHGTEAYSVTYLCDIGDPGDPVFSLRSTFYVVVKGNRSYSICIDDDVTTINEHAKVIDAIVKSFKLIESK